MLEGLTLTIIGMAIVFLFLILVILLIMVMSLLIRRYFSDQTPSLEGGSLAEVAVAIAAIKAFKQKH